MQQPMTNRFRKESQLQKQPLRMKRQKEQRGR